MGERGFGIGRILGEHAGIPLQVRRYGLGVHSLQAKTKIEQYREIGGMGMANQLELISSK